MSISKGFLATAKRAIKLDANTYQYFSRNPRGGAKRPLDLDDINAYLEFGHGKWLCNTFVSCTIYFKCL